MYRSSLEKSRPEPGDNFILYNENEKMSTNVTWLLALLERAVAPLSHFPCSVK